MGLLGIPRAAAGSTKTMHDGAEAFDLTARFGAADHFIVGHLFLRALLRISFSLAVRDWIPCSLILSRMRSTSFVSAMGEWVSPRTMVALRLFLFFGPLSPIWERRMTKSLSEGILRTARPKKAPPRCPALPPALCQLKMTPRASIVK